MSIRVVLADDHALFVEGVRALLRDAPGLDVVGIATSGLGALECIESTAPDVAVLDLSMPTMNGMQATREIVATHPEVRVLCLTMHAERMFVERALDAGASGYLLKDCDDGELVRAIEAVACGQVYIDPRVGRSVIEGYRERGREPPPSPFELLTDRERSVLQLLAEGSPTREIASRLHVSVKTIGTHREHIKQKLGIDSIAGLTKYAIREGMTGPM